MKDGGKIGNVLLSVCHCQNSVWGGLDRREQQARRMQGPAEPAGRVAPRIKKRSRVGARPDVEMHERGNRY